MSLNVPTQNSVHLYTHMSVMVGHMIIATFSADIHINKIVGSMIIDLYKRQSLVQPPLLHQFFTFFPLLWTQSAVAQSTCNWLGCFCLNTKCTKREKHYTIALRVPTQNSIHFIHTWLQW